MLGSTIIGVAVLGDGFAVNFDEQERILVRRSRCLQSLAGGYLRELVGLLRALAGFASNLFRP